MPGRSLPFHPLLIATFVQVKAAMRAAGNWPHVTAAVKYADWLALQNAEAARIRAGATSTSVALLESVVANEWPQRTAPALLAEAQRRGQVCLGDQRPRGGAGRGGLRSSGGWATQPRACCTWLCTTLRVPIWSCPAARQRKRHRRRGPCVPSPRAGLLRPQILHQQRL